MRVHHEPWESEHFTVEHFMHTLKRMHYGATSSKRLIMDTIMKMHHNVLCCVMPSYIHTAVFLCCLFSIFCVSKINSIFSTRKLFLISQTGLGISLFFHSSLFIIESDPSVSKIDYEFF